MGEEKEGRDFLQDKKSQLLTQPSHMLLNWLIVFGNRTLPNIYLSVNGFYNLSLPLAELFRIKVKMTCGRQCDYNKKILDLFEEYDIHDDGIMSKSFSSELIGQNND